MFSYSDYNYVRQSEGICTLVKGMPEPEHMQECVKNPGQVTYRDSSGYRRIPLTTCTISNGGLALDETGDEHPCPGKEDQYKKERRISGIGLFFAIFVPIAAAAGVGYWVYTNWSTSNFGQIRLGETSHFDDQAPFIKYPVMAISAVAALAIALPGLVSALWHEVSKLLGRSSRGRFTTRSSFARDSDYAAVDEDEGELLGEDSDEDV